MNVQRQRHVPKPNSNSNHNPNPIRKACARAGGLVDDRMDPAAVNNAYLYYTIAKSLPLEGPKTNPNPESET